MVSMCSLVCRVLHLAEPLPDFAVALKPDEYKLPPSDLSWNENNQQEKGDITPVSGGG